MTLVSIDVSKEKLDVFYDETNHHEIIQNSAAEIEKLVKGLLDLKNPWLVFEATGGYDKLLRTSALDKGINCSICNGLRVREFARSQGRLAKTDKIDVFLIAEYAKKTKLKVINSRDPSCEILRELNVRRKQVLDLINQEENKLEHDYSKFILQDINNSIEHLKESLSGIEDEIDKHIEKNPVLKEKKRLLETIPGIGKRAALVLIADLPELGELSKAKISSLAGLAPMNKDSGKYRGQRRTTHSRGQIKSVLFMAALSAVKHNPKIKPFYDRLKEKGKKSKVALVACMRKLVVYANVMLKDGVEFKS